MLGTSALGDVAALVEPIRRAVKDDRVTGLAGTLARMDGAGAFAAPGLFAPARSDHYARHLIWRDPESRFVVIGMTWSAGQGSPLHDHAGLWGAEVIVGGAMHETTFRLLERDTDDRYRFEVVQDRIARKGAVGILIPPLEYHDFGNAEDATAYTVHVYVGDLDRCLAFDDGGDGWWRARGVDLRYDA